MPVRKSPQGALLVEGPGQAGKASHPWMAKRPRRRAAARATHAAERPSSSGALLSGIRREIAKAKGILSLREDWDDQGSPPYRLETVRRATSFLERHAKWFSGLFGLALDVPRISPGPDGSIDVHWKTDSYELLVNIPGEGKKPASFYGDDYHQLYIKGTFDPSQVNQGFLQLWLPNRG